jgi:ethanolaminephosphotransferase
VYFLSGFVVLMYLHLDCLDGKQARRTKSSSPLGQLFDHGCDALSVHLITAQMAGTLAWGLAPWWSSAPWPS